MDPERSFVNLSGTVAGSEIREQGPGSLTTTGTGSLDVEVDGSTIRIVSGSLEARNNGSWAPAEEGEPGTEPANFGARATLQLGITVNGAVREIVLGLESPAIEISGGEFPAEEVTFSIATNTPAFLDYSAPFFGSSREELAGVSTNRTATVGRIAGPVGERTFTLTVDTTFYMTLASENDSELRITGELVATEQASTAPAFQNIEIVDGQVRITVTNGGSGYELQSSTDLQTWATREPQVETINETTTVYTIPAGGDWEFYRLIEDTE